MLDQEYVDVGRLIFECARTPTGGCPLKQESQRRSEAWLGDPSSPIMLLGTNPNELACLPYYGSFETYLNTICSVLPRIRQDGSWELTEAVLECVSLACGQVFSLAQNNVCVFNPIHCVTSSSKVLGVHLRHPVALPCSLKPMETLLQKRRRVIVAHGEVAFEYIWRMIQPGDCKPTSFRAAVEGPVVPAKDHLIIPTYHLMSRLSRPRAQKTMDLVAAKIEHAAAAIRAIVEVGYGTGRPDV